MTPAAFLKLALCLPETTEGVHMGQSDLRIAGKIFASRADSAWFAMTHSAVYLKLTREPQAMLCTAEPELFAPVTGGWGLKGATWIEVAKADARTAKSALWVAWRNPAPKTLLKRHPT